MAPPLQLDESDWRCAICLDLQYKPCFNACGHGVCFWCVHQAMSPFEASACALCRARFAHLPRVCPRLHALLQAAFPERYQQRARETAELEAERGAESEAVEVEPALAESAARLIAGDDSRSSFLNNPPPLLACDTCRGMLFEPSILPCGHVVCRGCVPLQREHCAMPVLSEPGVCMPLDKVVRAAVPEATIAAAAAAAAARRSSSGDGGAGSGRPSSTGGGAETVAAAGEAAAAAAAAAAGAAAGEAATRDPHFLGPPPEVAELLASGRPLRAVWPEVQRALLRVADTRFVWGGVGCDSCGMMPIVGRRYRCRECPEAIGFDLCGPCHDRGPTGQGRFNQQHTPQHRLEKVEPAGSLGSIYQPDNLMMLVNFLQMVHPELSFDRVMQLLWMELIPEDLAGRAAAAANAAAAAGGAETANSGDRGDGDGEEEGEEEGEQEEGVTAAAVEGVQGPPAQHEQQQAQVGNSSGGTGGGAGGGDNTTPAGTQSGSAPGGRDEGQALSGGGCRSQ